MFSAIAASSMETCRVSPPRFCACLRSAASDANANRHERKNVRKRARFASNRSSQSFSSAVAKKSCARSSASACGSVQRRSSSAMTGVRYARTTRSNASLRASASVLLRACINESRVSGNWRAAASLTLLSLPTVFVVFSLPAIRAAVTILQLVLHSPPPPLRVTGRTTCPDASRYAHPRSRTSGQG